MAHKYYCTNCARELDQDHVLIDMEYALTVSGEHESEGEQDKGAQKFRLVKFRVTVQEFQKLIDRGTVCDQNFKRIDLSLQELAGYLANERNLKDPAIAGLTLDDIDGYLNHHERDFGIGGFDDGDAEDIFSGTGFDSDLFGGPAKSSEKVEEEYVPSEAIETLKKKNKTAQGDLLSEHMFVEELSLLRKLMSENGGISICIKPRYERADTGDDILIGYYARRDKKTITVDARLCYHCDTPVFQHAGAAVHKAVAFIGEQASGKTSTILALTSYAVRAAAGILPGDEIWGGSSSIPGIEIMEVVGKKGLLKQDLELYEIGVAPRKNDAKYRDQAYSSTLWITNSAGKKFILTLIDLPGELCKDDGTIYGDRILNDYPVAMASDVFIMCFDTVRAQGSAAAEIISRTCSWASHFQTLRQDYKKDSTIREPGDTSPELSRDCVAPMIVLFTKCEELESDEPEVREERNYFNPRRVDEVYSLKVEREFINRNPVYMDVGRKVQIYENLKHAYVARLRTSPYGFAAPQKPNYLEDNSLNKNEDGTIRYPRPRHVAELMKWLMCITGCIPIPAEFCPNPGEPEHVYRLRDCYIQRPQYRVWDPQGSSIKEKQDEAMCRAYLFENYSETDKEYINNVFEQPVQIPWRWSWLKKKRNS